MILIFCLNNLDLGGINDSFLSGMYDRDEQSIVISQSEFVVILEATVRTFVEKIGSPKLRTFYQYERHRASYADLFRRSVGGRNRNILDHIQAQCVDRNSTQVQNVSARNKIKYQLYPYSLAYTNMLGKLCLDDPPLLLLHPLSYFAVQYQKEMKDQMSNMQAIITPAESIKQVIKADKSSTETNYLTMFDRCDLCDAKFSAVVTAETAQEDLAYLVDQSRCEVYVDIQLVGRELATLEQEEKNFWKKVQTEDIEELLKLSGIQDDLAVTGFDGEDYFMKMGIDVRV